MLQYAFPTGVSPNTYRKVKSRYEELAAIVNRLKYYDACFRGDRIVHCMLKLVNLLMFDVFDVDVPC